MVDVEHHEGPSGQVLLDDRCFPVIITTWQGQTSSAMLDAFYAWLDRQLARAVAQDVKLAMVNDSLELGRVDGAQRARFVRETDARKALLDARMAGVYVVVRRAFLLGVLASIAHFVRGGLKISTFRDMPSALERALLKLDHLGIPRPPGLDPHRYERPRRSAVA